MIQMEPLGRPTPRRTSAGDDRPGAAEWRSELDAIDGTHAPDRGPVMARFLSRGELRQRAWSDEPTRRDREVEA